MSVSTIETFTEYEDAVSALFSLQPPLDRDDWFALLAAFHDATGGAGMDAARQWSEAGENYDARNFDQTWKTIKPGNITKNTLFRRAIDRGWKSNGKPIPPDPAEAKARKRQTEKDQQNRLNEQKKVAQEVRKQLEAAEPASQENPYLQVKQVQPHNLKQSGDVLLMPLYDQDKKLWSLQSIHPDGKKFFPKGGRASGCFHVIGNLKTASVGYVGEGFATVATLVELMPGSAGVVALSAGNISKVIEALPQYRDIFVVLADNDAANAHNAGIEAGREALSNYGVPYTYPDLPPGMDKADFNDLFLARGSEEVSRQIKDNLSTSQPKEAGKTRDTRFSVSKSGVFHRDETGEVSPVCSPLWVTATTRDADQNNFGRLLEWNDPDGHAHQWAMPADFLAGDGRDIFRALYNGGLEFIHNKKRLTEYVATHPVTARARCVTKTGWHDGAFVLPDTVIGTGKIERLILQNGESGTNHYKTRGTLEDWQRDISAYCIGNSRLVFAVSMAFAAPLLELAGMDGGGFNFRGNSSEGKSTALQVATSVCGGRDYLCTWRATSNGLEGVAAIHNDALLVLDEMGQVAPKEAGEIAYMLANGQGKQRAGRSGAARSKHEWRTLFLSSGEISLADHLLANGQTIKAGQEVRLADIPMSTGVYGGFEELHNFEGGAALADYLKNASGKIYGAPFREYLHKITAQVDKIREATKAVQQDFIREHCPSEADGQVHRVALRFALVAAGGDFATSLGITGWPKDEAVRAAETCFKVWLKERGTVGNAESQIALNTIMKFFQIHGGSRFEDWNGTNGKTIPNRAGYVSTENGESRYYVFPQIFKTEICRGINHKLGLKALAEKNLLIADSGRNDISRQPPGAAKNSRFYCILGSVISDV